VRSLLVAAGAGVVLLATASAVPAQQAASATASAPRGVLYNTCVDHLADYAVSLDSPSSPWFLSLGYTAPDGTPLESNYASSTFGDPMSGVMAIRVCGDTADPGTFTLSGRLQYDVIKSTPVAPTTFTLRNPFTNTAARPSTGNPRKGQKVTVKVLSRDEMPGGYERKDDATVLLQHKTAKGWTKVRGSRTATDDKGRARIAVRYTGGRLKLRAVTKGSADWDRSHSRRIVLR
jgi:hypothetical protein